jgi:hypothetical protein
MLRAFHPASVISQKFVTQFKGVIPGNRITVGVARPGIQEFQRLLDAFAGTTAETTTFLANFCDTQAV